MCLTETLDEMVSNGILSPELAIQILVQFDKVFAKVAYLITRQTCNNNSSCGGWDRYLTVFCRRKEMRFSPGDLTENNPTDWYSQV
ncbi:putative transcription initiation factor IIA, gamma subunit [Helianthus annuus]|nr:putative transcription initiation factor IIA, gamma subunit [Helianthus annuus]